MIVELSDTSNETVLAGSPLEYERLARALEQGGGSFALEEGPVRQGTPLSTLVVETGDSVGVRIKADREGRRLLMSGPVSKLSVLADIVRDSAGTGDPAGHVHIEYYPDHFYLDEDSDPLILWDATD